MNKKNYDFLKEEELLRQVLFEFENNIPFYCFVDEIKYESYGYPDLNIYSYKRTKSGMKYEFKSFLANAKFVIKNGKIFLQKINGKFKNDIDDDLKKIKSFNYSFDSCLKEIIKCNLKDWNIIYLNNNIHDGECWKVEITFKSISGKKKLYFVGENNYPIEWKKFIKIMKRPLRLYGLFEYNGY